MMRLMPYYIGASGGGAPPPPITRGNSTVAASAGDVASLDIAVPAGTANGDTLVLVVVGNDGRAPTPNGVWVQQADVSNVIGQFTSMEAQVFTRTANGEPALYTVTPNALAPLVLIMIDYKNVNAAAPINVLQSTVTPDNTTQTVPTPGIVTTVPNTQVLRIAACKRSALGDIVFTAGGGEVIVQQAVAPAGGNPNRGGCVEDFFQAAAGAVPGENVVTNIAPDNARFAIGITLALKQ